ncbi:unnamed protein product [Strongylus vulgaris]|uniref:Uncharacterized protein n=1 Tax=Strongylus vulgaris TaxID=40348 RepID=A0A3P7IQZ7_STRVU|nr:unnamed protein product [Strongylus vulgaris]
MSQNGLGSLNDAAQYTSICRLLIEKLAVVPKETFNPEEFAEILCCLAENRRISPHFVERCMTAANMKTWKAPSEILPPNAVPENKNAEVLFLRNNRAVLLSSGMLSRTLELLWPLDALSLCEEQDSLVLQNADKVHIILQTDWINIDSYCPHIPTPFTAAALACVNSALSTSSFDMELSCSLLENVVRSFALSLSSSPSTLGHLFNSIAKLLGKASKNRNHLMRIVKSLELISVWINFTLARHSKLPSSLWNALDEMLSIVAEQMENRAKEAATGAKAVPIASPEESLNDESVAGNWLESILEQVPAMLDQQSAVQSQIVSEIVEITKRIKFLFRIVSSVRDVSHCNESISSVFKKVQNLSNADIIEYLQNAYITLSNHSLLRSDLQNRLLEEILASESSQKAALLQTLVSGSSGSTRSQLVASIFKHALEQYRKADSLKITERICREECSVLEESSHYLTKQYAKEFSKQAVSLLQAFLAE